MELAHCLHRLRVATSPVDLCELDPSAGALMAGTSPQRKWRGRQRRAVGPFRGRYVNEASQWWVKKQFGLLRVTRHTNSR